MGAQGRLTAKAGGFLAPGCSAAPSVEQRAAARLFGGPDPGAVQVMGPTVARHLA